MQNDSDRLGQLCPKMYRYASLGCLKSLGVVKRLRGRRDQHQPLAENRADRQTHAQLTCLVPDPIQDDVDAMGIGSFGIAKEQVMQHFLAANFIAVPMQHFDEFVFLAGQGQGNTIRADQFLAVIVKLPQ